MKQERKHYTIIDRALWRLLVNGATSDTPYPRIFAPYLRAAIEHAHGIGRADIASFAQLQLDLITLQEPVEESKVETPVGPTTSWSFDLEPALSFFIASVLITSFPFVLSILLGSMSHGVTGTALDNPPLFGLDILMYLSPIAGLLTLLGGILAGFSWQEEVHTEGEEHTP